MNLARISVFYLWQRRLATALNISMLAFGVAAVTLLILTSAQVEERIERDARGVDLVIGARGSPAQIVLSTIYGMETPAGSIPWSEVAVIGKHEAVARAIPVALGDSYRGFRIVGTTPDYIDHYRAPLAQGRPWLAPLEAVIGADVAARLKPLVGSTFTAVHGLAGAGEAHAGSSYRIVGVLGHTGTIVDRLVLTSVESYWTLHPRKASAESELVAEPAADDGHAVSALLIQYRVGARGVDFVRYVNALGELQAASPAEETARIFGLSAVGMDLLRGFALVLMISAAFSIFMALYNGISERRYDLAVMRALGATRERIMALLLFEGVILSLAGAVIGLALGHLFTSMLGIALRQAQQVSVTGWTWYPGELWVLVLALVVGIVTALFPAWRAHEIDIAGTLARG